MKAASELFAEGAKVSPKGRYQVVRGLNNLGYSERRACQVVGLSRSTYNKIKFHTPNDREIRRLWFGLPLTRRAASGEEESSKRRR